MATKRGDSYAFRFFTVWNGMMQRCHNPNNPKYRRYGERGITVCKRWRKYENFEEDMYDEWGYFVEENPIIGKKNNEFTLDRIDNSKGYYKENCRWVSMKVQANNRG